MSSLRSTDVEPTEARHIGRSGAFRAGSRGASWASREPFLALFAVVACAACAGSLSRIGTVEGNIGRATQHDIQTEVPEALRRYGYAIYRSQDTGSTLYIETGWQERAPFDDEAERGVEYARTRFVARARKAGPGIFRLTISAENQVQGATPGFVEAEDRAGWHTIPATDMYKAYVGEIHTEIQLKVDAGVRTYGIRGSLQTSLRPSS